MKTTKGCHIHIIWVKWSNDYDQVHINSLEVTGCPKSVLQNTGDDVNIDRRFSDVRQAFKRPSQPEPEFQTNQNNLPQILQVLDKVDQQATVDPGERWDLGIAVFFIDFPWLSSNVYQPVGQMLAGEYFSTNWAILTGWGRWGKPNCTTTLRASLTGRKYWNKQITQSYCFQFGCRE